MTLTHAELDDEMQYRKEERLGILCGTNPATAEQMALAKREAVEWRDGWGKEMSNSQKGIERV